MNKISCTDYFSWQIILVISVFMAIKCLYPICLKLCKLQVQLRMNPSSKRIYYKFCSLSFVTATLNTKKNSSRVISVKYAVS